MENLFFYFFSALAVASGIMVVSRRNPVSAALFLVLTFFALAGIYVLMDAFFLAAVQVVVYAGAIMVLFLFVIMLLNLAPDELPRVMTGKVKWLFAVTTAALTVTLLAIDLTRRLPADTPATLQGEAEMIGDKLFSDFLLPFELTALLLLVAIVGAVIMARRERRGV